MVGWAASCAMTRETREERTRAELRSIFGYVLLES
jgi:hypothetical protein